MQAQNSCSKPGAQAGGLRFQMCIVVIKDDGVSVRWEDKSKSLQSSVWLNSEVRAPVSRPSTLACFLQRVYLPLFLRTYRLSWLQLTCTFCGSSSQPPAMQSRCMPACAALCALQLPLGAARVRAPLWPLRGHPERVCAGQPCRAGAQVPWPGRGAHLRVRMQ